MYNTTFKNLNQKLNELEDESKYLEAINLFTSKLMNFTSIEDTFWGIAEYGVSNLDYEDCVIYRVSGEELIQVASYGYKHGESRKVLNPMAISIGEGIVGDVALTGQSEIVNNTTFDRRYIVDDKLRFSEITVPIILDGKVIGIIDSENSMPDFYTIEDQKILESIAAASAIKIGQIEALDKLKEINQTLEDKVAQKTKALQASIQELESVNLQLKRENIESQALIKDTHHRVKNNLQVISSLLSLQELSSKDQVDHDLILEIKGRIFAMAAVHQKIYALKELHIVNLKEYLGDLYNTILESSLWFQNPPLFNFEFSNEVYLDSKKAFPLGLILNELLTNSFKYAFKGNIQNSITLHIETNTAGLKFCYSDSGDGLPDGINLKKPGSLGLDLIKTLCKQLYAKCSYDNNRKEFIIEAIKIN